MHNKNQVSVIYLAFTWLVSLPQERSVL